MRGAWQSQKVRLWVLSAALLAGGILLRLYGISTRLLWEDEVYYLKRSALGMPLTDAPLSTFLLHEFLLATDITPFNLYLFAALWGSAALISFLLLARTISQEPVYLLGCLSFIAFSPVAVFYSQAGRPYGLLLFITPLILLAFLGSYRRGALQDWLWFLVVAVAGTCIHLVTAQLLLGLCLAVSIVTLFQRLEGDTCGHRWRRLFLVFAVCGVAVGAGLIDLRSPESNSYLIKDFRPYDGGLLAFTRAFVDGLGATFIPETGPFSLRDSVGLALLGLATFGSLRLRRDGKADVALILCCSIVVPGTIMYFTLGSMYFWPWLRYVCHLSVPFGLLCVYGVVSLVSSGRAGPAVDWSRVVLTIALFPGFASASYKMWRQESREGWGGPVQIAARRSCDRNLPKLTGYFSSWDRTADLLWFNFSGCDRPPVYLMAPSKPGELLKQQDSLGPRPGQKMPLYEAISPSLVEPGRYLLVSAFWLTSECSIIQQNLKGVMSSRDITASEPSIARFNNLRLCELTRR